MASWLCLVSLLVVQWIEHLPRGPQEITMLCEQQNFDNDLLQFRFATYTPQTSRLKARIKMPWSAYSKYLCLKLAKLGFPPLLLRLNGHLRLRGHNASGHLFSKWRSVEALDQEIWRSGINSNWNRKDPALGQETRFLIVLIKFAKRRGFILCHF